MSGNKVLIDINIALYLLKGEQELDAALQSSEIFISFVTELELLGFKEIRVRCSFPSFPGIDSGTDLRMKFSTTHSKKKGVLHVAQVENSSGLSQSVDSLEYMTPGLMWAVI